MCEIFINYVLFVFPPGDLSYGDLLTSLPFGNDIVALTVTGATLKKAFENSAVALTDDAKSGRFLQVSGKIKTTTK